MLDIDLNGENVFPIADQLAQRGIPFVFFSGRTDIAIPLRFRDATRLTKSLAWESVFESLFPSGIEPAPSLPRADAVITVLPKLRLAARLLIQDPDAADRLVEVTLEEAIDCLSQEEGELDLESWLSDLLERTHRRVGTKLLQ